jgi:Flp pilus assembly pilin Flp
VGPDLTKRSGSFVEELGMQFKFPIPRSGELMNKILKNFHCDESGLETMEYVVLATLVAALMTLAIIALFNTIVTKIKEINSSL